MKSIQISIIALLFTIFSASTQEIKIDEVGELRQVYGNTIESQEILPFNDLNIEFGYVLYQAEINVESEDAILEFENVRDYAVVYVDDKLQGTVSDSDKKITLNVESGKYQLKIYVENIGRITYGPEILDNNKGLFGTINIDGSDIEGWFITPLNIKGCNIDKLEFKEVNLTTLPSFHRGYFDLDNPTNRYLDIRGWGMGEVWINGNYIGSYWENEKQQSIQIPEDNLQKGKNIITVFEMKNNDQKTMKISNSPIFK